MQFSFSKYSGCGNDFVLIDDRGEGFPTDNVRTIQNICHRQKGIGADGIILLQNSSVADFRMRILNADGSEAEMCGNGIRCLMKFIQELGINFPSGNVETLHTIHGIALNEDGRVSVEMGKPVDVAWDVDIALPSCIARLHCLNTGVPHVVEFVEALPEIDVHARGASIRNHVHFSPKGTNYNAAEVLSEETIAVRTYERGVEAETLACGTGATAAALAAAKAYGFKSPITVQTKSGESLKIHFEFTTSGLDNVWMTGPANKTFSGNFQSV